MEARWRSLFQNQYNHTLVHWPFFLPYLKIFVACKAKFDYMRKRYIKEGLADNIVVLLGIPEISSSHRTKLGEIPVESG